MLGGDFPLGAFPMLDTATTALLRAVFEEVCEGVSRHETGARTHVASKSLEAATKGETSPRQSAAGRPSSSLAYADDVAIIARAGDLEAQCLALLVMFRLRRAGRPRASPGDPDDQRPGLGRTHRTTGFAHAQP